MKFKTQNLIITIIFLCSATFTQHCYAQDPFIGEVRYFAGNYAPRGWALCNGQMLSIATNQALFSILGTTYGGDGRTNFALPDVRGRTIIHHGSGPGLSSYSLGQKGGQETVTLTSQQMPEHNHDLRATEATANRSNPNGNSLAAKTRTSLYSDSATTVTLESSSISDRGGNQAHENRPPYIALNCIIALEGVFPSRN